MGEHLNSLILAGFLKVTAPSSIVLLPKFPLLVIGGGRAGGSFRVVPRVRRSKIEKKCKKLVNVEDLKHQTQFNYENVIERSRFS